MTGHRLLFQPFMLHLFFSVYFTTVIMPEGGSVVWAYMTGITAILVAIVAPFLGSYADSSGKFKELIVFFICIGSIATGLLWFARPDTAFYYLCYHFFCNLNIFSRK